MPEGAEATGQNLRRRVPNSRAHNYRVGRLFFRQLQHSETQGYGVLVEVGQGCYRK